MVHSEPQQPQTQERRRLDDDLIGLDRDDPEVQAFAAHLDRTHRLRPGFTIEGFLSDVTDLAESANRAQGPRWLAAVLVVALVLAVMLWEPTRFLFTALLG
ncbi:MAG: hypothetical protein M3186_03115 [Actinomycetota bacterium]|nr:hypothetical protein [Actinomycetota bacterium]